MPLSEHEQRLLDQLEQQLHDEDPKFAHTLASDPARSLSTRHIVIGILVMIAGIMVLLGGVAIKVIVVGIIGFLIMGAGVYIAISRPKFSRGPAGGAKSATKPKSGFMNNLEERWEERRKDQ
ncbi:MULTISPECIES: DUF3040 domain-containing protein [unclassified Arthrobacter]|uniref:DUF3040 domain-containing protein n=1 Tax=unclassified Arthrobacter TaxID=235627 RepID=UPI00159E1FBC|nr:MULTISPECIES: DUF3040 domain-containing protein [unclassified Arthrobacter]MCQ9164273.1 DUF3040 domain-containing protein [Arthrobacter sp. STN4]NVN00222.1 DUF3040 domain-containing protein [Arthrobacter sp. SDTb3-6]